MDHTAGEILDLRHAAWAQVCEEQYPRLLSYARWLTKNTDRAPGIVHEAVCKILDRSPDPERIKNKANYLLRVVYTTWIDRLREKKKATTISLDDPENEELRSKLAAPEIDVSSNFDNETYRKAIKLEFKRLNERERLLLELFLQDFTCDEIAARLHEDVRLTRSDLNAMRAKVRYRLMKALGKTKTH